MRLIDADKIRYMDLNRDMPQSKVRVWVSFKEWIDAMPTIEERKTGRWIDMDDHVMCSCCGATHYGADKNYCPNCGTRMRGREK